MNIFEWLRSNGYDYTWNVELGGKIPDIVAFKENEIIAFEIKKIANEISKAIGQCLKYRKQANKVYIVLPISEISFLKKTQLSILKEHGIGLIAFNADLKIVVEAKSSSFFSEKLIKQLKEKSLTGSEPANSEEKIKKQILDLISEHPEGLTITDISRILRFHRQTVTKYILTLEALDKIYRRRIGAVTLHYLKEKWERLRV